MGAGGGASFATTHSSRLTAGFSAECISRLPRRAAAHADVLERAAKPCGFVAFKVRQRHKHIGIHDSAAYFGLAHIVALYVDLDVVGALEPVGNQHVAAGRERLNPLV